MTTINSTVPVINLGDYLTQDFKLVVPPWQREYTWVAEDEQQIGQLLEDLISFASDDEAEDYLMGAIILCDTEGTKDKLIIDGQQRTLTLYLFLLAAFKYIMKNRLINSSDSIHTHFWSKLSLSLGKTNYGFEPRIKLNQSKAGEIIRLINDWSSSESEEINKILENFDTYSKTQQNIIDAATYLYKRLSEDTVKWADDSKLVSAIIKIFNGVKFIQIPINSQTEAIKVFDRINNRGIQLSNADLIKNQLFQKVDDSEFEVISENWQNMTAVLNTAVNSKIKEPKYLLRALAWTHTDQKITYDKLLKFYLDEYLLHNDPKLFSESLLESADELVLYSKLNHSTHTDLLELQEMHIPQYLGSVQHYPLLLAGSKISDSETFSHFLHQVSMRTLFYILSQQRPPEFESIIPRWANRIRQAGVSVSINDLDVIYKEFRPSDELIQQLQNNIINWKISNSLDKKRIRASLAFLSWYLDKQINGVYTKTIEEYTRTRKKRGEKSGWDLDHVFPRSQSQDLKNPNLVDSIGNLVLLSPSDNKSQQDQLPNEKKANYHGSKLLLSQSLVFGSSIQLASTEQKALEKLLKKFEIKELWNIESWSDESINKRTDAYKTILLKLLTLELY